MQHGRILPGDSVDAPGAALHISALFCDFYWSSGQTFSGRYSPHSCAIRIDRLIAMQKSFQEMVERIVEKDPRYDKEAYDFLKEALEFTIKQQKRGHADPSVHVTAAELMDGFRQYALKEFGPMVMTVLEHWRVTSSEDVGNIVFNLIEAGVFGKTDSDRRQDFRAAIDFHAAFIAPYEASQTGSAKRA
jgi:uncharacterized repeat protein (TIGR04138 family)